MARKKIGLWAESVVASNPRGVAFCARAICGCLSPSETVEYLAISDIIYDSGLVSVEVYPLDVFLGAALRGDRREEMNRIGIYPKVIPAGSLDSLMSVDCFERIWDWPLRHLGIRSACIVHDLVPFRVKELPYRDHQTPYFTRLGRVVDMADVLVCNSRTTADDLRTMFPEVDGKICFTYHGQRSPVFSSDVISATRRSQAGLRVADTVTLLMVGAVEPRSNFQIVLAAVPRMANALAPRKLRLVWVGEHPEQGDIFENQFNHVLRQAREVATVILPGYLDGAALLDWYCSADVFVHPALWEGFGFALLEAMAAGIPVVASDLPALHELGGDCVRYFDPYDTDDLAEKVAQAASMSPRSRALDAERAREHAACFTWEQTAADCERVLVALASGDTIGKASALVPGTTMGPSQARKTDREPVSEGFVFPLGDLMAGDDPRVAALEALLRERVRERPGAVAVILTVDRRSLDELNSVQVTGIEWVEQLDRALRGILAAFPAVAVKVMPLGEPTEFTPHQLAIIRAVENLHLPRPVVTGRNAVSDAVGSAIDQWPLELDVVYAVSGRTVVELGAGVVRFNRAQVIVKDLGPVQPASAEPVPCEAIDPARSRELLMPGERADALTSRAFRAIWVHGGLVGALAALESPRHDLARTTATQCSEWLIERCPALESGISCLVMVADPADCRGVRSAMLRVDPAGAQSLERNVVTVVPVDQQRRSSALPAVLPLRNADSRKLLSLMADVVIGKSSGDPWHLMTELGPSALAGKRIILVGRDVDPWIAQVLRAEVEPDFASALEKAFSQRPSERQTETKSLAYPPGWTIVLRALRRHAAGRKVPPGDLGPVKKALSDPRTQAWGLRLRKEHLIDDEWESFISHIAAVPAPQEVPRSAVLSTSGPAINLARKGLTSAIIEAPAAFRDKRIRRAAGRIVQSADRARDERDWPTAAAGYRKALDIDPRQPAIWVQLGHALKEQGDLEGAEEAYHRSLLLDDNTADTYLQLGHVLKLQGRMGEAENAYFRALARDADCHFAGRELAALGYSAEAMQEALARRFLGTARRAIS